MDERARGRGARFQPLETVAASEPFAPQVGGTSGDMPHMIRALRHRDFRLFWGGNFLSNIGTWMQNVAMGWLVLQLAPSQSRLLAGRGGLCLQRCPCWPFLCSAESSPTASTAAS